jgi:hypothetical protein
MSDAHWQPLRDELDRWADAGLKARLWLRDDDAIEPTDALSRLHELAIEHAIPATIAAIPARTGEALAQYAGGSHTISIAVHGWSHTNHAPEGEKKQELGPHRPIEAICSELSVGFHRLKALFADQFLPVLVPPWNRIDRSLLPNLPSIGFAALSAFGRKTYDEIPTINTHVDLIDWHGSRRCADHSQLIERVAAELIASRLSERYAVGLLTHHRMHDEMAWAFVQNLFEATRHPACEWQSLRWLMSNEVKA